MRFEGMMLLLVEAVVVRLPLSGTFSGSVCLVSRGQEYTVSQVV